MSALIAVAIANGADSAPLQVSQGSEEASPIARPMGRSVGAAPDGRVLVTWGQATGDGGQYRVWGRVIGKNGAPEGGQFPITPLSEDGKAVSSGGAGVVARGRRNEFLLTWAQTTGDSPAQTLVARRYRSDGTPVAPEFVLARNVGEASVVFGARRGEYLVAWTGQRDGVVRAARLRAGTSKLAHRVRVPVSVRDNASDPDPFAVTSAYDSARGTYFLAWSAKCGCTGFDSDYAVYGRTIPKNSGRRLGRIRRLSRPGLTLPALEFSPARREFLLATTFRHNGDDAVWLARVDGRGRRVGPEKLVAGPGTGGSLFSASLPVLTVAPRGSTVVAFRGRVSDEDNQGHWLHYRRVNKNLTKLGPLGRISTGDLRTQADSAVVTYSAARGDFPVVWSQGLAPEPTPPASNDEAAYPRHEVFLRFIPGPARPGPAR